MSLRCDHIATPLRWSCRPRCRVHGRDVEWIGLKEERYHRMKQWENMKYWTCWGLENIRMLWMLLFNLDEMKSGLCWHEWKRICHVPAVCFDLYETMVSVLNHEMKPLSIFLRMKPGRSILTAAQVTVVSSLSTQSKKNWAPKSSQWFFCWRCAFCMNTFLTIPRTQREELDRYDVRSRDQTREILGAD